MSSKVQTPLTEEEIDKMIAEHDANSGKLKSQMERGQSCWDAGIKIHKTCTHMEVPDYTVEYTILVNEKIKLLQKSYPSLEWLGYLVGELDHENHIVYVEDIVIPDQVVTGVNVYNVEYSWNDNLPIIGVIHSHHSMGAFFSGTDDAYINQNHDVSIVVSTSPRSPVKGQVRVKAPCGDYVLSENLTFRVEKPEVDGLDAFEADFKSKIKTFTPTVFPRFSFIQKGGVGATNVAPKTGSASANTSGNAGNATFTVSSGQGNTLSEKEIREGLLEFYTDEEVDEFMEDHLWIAEQELLLLRKAIAEEILFEEQDMEGVWDSEEESEGDGPDVWPGEEDEETVWDLSEEEVIEEGEEDPYNPSWMTGEGDNKEDPNSQNGLHQASYGVQKLH